MSILKGAADELTVPAEAEIQLDGSVYKKIKFKVRFRIRKVSDAMEVMKGNEGEDADILRHDVVRIFDYPGEQGARVSSDDHLEEDGTNGLLEDMIEHQPHRNALSTAWQVAQFGRRAAKLKNL